MEVWAQITLRGKKGAHGSSDVVFSVLNGVGAETQDAVWWMPTNGIVDMALGNSSDSAIHSSIELSGGETGSVDIAPHGTEYIRRTVTGGTGKAQSVKVTTIGAGALKASGYVVASDSSFTSSVRFYETPLAKQPNLYATDLSVDNSTARML